MAEDIESLIRKRDALDRRIKYLKASNGRYKIKVTHHPTYDDDWRAHKTGMKAEEYDAYSLVIKYQPIYDGAKPIWEPMFVARSKAEVLEAIPQIISDLEGALDAFKESED